MLLRRNAGWLFVLLVFVSGCTTVAMNAGFDDVRGTVEERSAIKIFWNNGTDLDKEAAEKVDFVAEGEADGRRGGPDRFAQQSRSPGRLLGPRAWRRLIWCKRDSSIIRSSKAAVKFPNVWRSGEFGAYHGDELSRCLLYAASQARCCARFDEAKLTSHRCRARLCCASEDRLLFTSWRMNKCSSCAKRLFRHSTHLWTWRAD